MVISQKEYVRRIAEALDVMSGNTGQINEGILESDMVICTEEHLAESNLSRILGHTQGHHIATITAYRNPHGKTEKKLENIKQNKILKQQLYKAGFGVTNMYGKYNETGESGMPEEVKEHSFFVVGPKKGEAGADKFFKTMKALGRAHGQNSILYKDPDSKEAFLHSTAEEGKNNGSWLDDMPGKKADVGRFAPHKINPDGSSSLKGISFSYMNANPPAPE